jgi:hypothetical protein
MNPLPLPVDFNDAEAEAFTRYLQKPRAKSLVDLILERVDLILERLRENR